jgi:hypothetical protein
MGPAPVARSVSRDWDLEGTDGGAASRAVTKSKALSYLPRTRSPSARQSPLPPLSRVAEAPRDADASHPTERDAGRNDP